MTEKEISEVLHRLKERFDTIEDTKNLTVMIKGKEIDVVKLALEDWERLKEENHENFINSQHIISALIEEIKRLKGEKK